MGKARSRWEDAAAAAAVGMVAAHHALVAPDRPAVVWDGGHLTFAELDARANRLVRALRARGVGPGSAVSILLPNRPEWAVVFEAVRRGGYRLTTINWHLTGGEAGYIVDDSQSAALIAGAAFAECATAAVAAAPRCRVRLAVGGAIDGFEPFDGVLDAEDGSAVPDPTLGGTMLYTSGTTGRPKGVYRRDVPTAPSVIASVYRYDPATDLNLCTGPLYHAAPFAFCLVAPLTAGVGVVLMERWDPEDTLRRIERHRITHTHLVPTMFHRLLSLPDDVRARYDLSSLKLVLHGAAPCPVPVKRDVIEWFGPVVVEYYAATEGTGCIVDSATWLERPGTVGRPADPDHFRIVDDAGRTLPPGTVGTVYIKAPATGRFEYFGDEEKTRSSYLGDHFTLGDMGYLDEDGYLFLTDRSADLVISGGVNIYPAEVDAVLLTHPAVADVATIGVPDDEWGETVVAVVEPKDGVAPDDDLAADLVEWCRARLAHYKCPRRVDFVEHLPREDNGKIYKRRLRDRYRTAAATAPERS